MKRRRSLFLHLNQLKLLAKKFALVILFLAAIILMLLNKNHSLVLERTSGSATGAAAAVVEVLVIPAKILARGYDYLAELKEIKKDNKILQEENRKLRVLQDKYKALEVENRLLSELLNYVPLPEAGFVSARVVAEESNAFAHAMLAYVADANVAKGDIVIADSGVVGRVDKIADKYAKIILITDGGENCGGDPCAFASALIKQRRDIVIDVLLVSSSSKALRCLSDTTGGKFYNAEDVNSFTSTLTESMTQTAQPSTQKQPEPQQKYEFLDEN